MNLQHFRLRVAKLYFIKQTYAMLAWKIQQAASAAKCFKIVHTVGKIFTLAATRCKNDENGENDT